MAVVGKIDRSGVLYIARAGRLVEQICPHGGQNCSHHCPLFGEPFWHEQFDRVGISLCGRVIVMFDGFVDERMIPNNGEDLHPGD